MTLYWSLKILILLTDLPDLHARGYVHLSVRKFKTPNGQPFCTVEQPNKHCLHQWSIGIRKGSSNYEQIYQTKQLTARQELDIPPFRYNITLDKLTTSFEIIFTLNDSSYSSVYLPGLRYVRKVKYPVEPQSYQEYLDYKITRVCSPGYFHHFCDHYCKPQDDIEGHYTCNSSGEKICLPAWANPSDNCKMDICSTEPCFNNGSCSIVNQRIHCQCKEPSYGRLCEMCKVYLNDQGECQPIPPTGEAIGKAVRLSYSAIYIIGGLSAVLSIIWIIRMQDKENQELTFDTEKEPLETVEGSLGKSTFSLFKSSDYRH